MKNKSNFAKYIQDSLIGCTLNQIGRFKTVCIIQTLHLPASTDYQPILSNSKQPGRDSLLSVGSTGLQDSLLFALRSATTIKPILSRSLAQSEAAQLLNDGQGTDVQSVLATMVAYRGRSEPLAL